jgi:hypothetical protein
VRAAGVTSGRSDVLVRDGVLIPPEIAADPGSAVDLVHYRGFDQIPYRN